MYYEEGCGSYCNESLEPIFDTKFRYGVPYKIDRKKYEAILKKYNNDARIKDADVVTFSAHLNHELDSDYFAFFVEPKNSPKNSKDFYDCIQFSDLHENEGRTFNKRLEFVHDLLECIIEPSIDHIQEMMDNICNNMDKELDQIHQLESIAFPE